jgi:hypothetical protein
MVDFTDTQLHDENVALAARVDVLEDALGSVIERLETLEDASSPAPPPPPPPDSISSKLRFSPPTLVNPTTIEVTPALGGLKLDSTRDYILRMPSVPYVRKGGLSINGGRRVVIVGGEVHHPQRWDDASQSNRGIYLQGQSEHVHIEGLRVSGYVREGVNISKAGAVVSFQNCYFDDIIETDRDGHHGDVIQSWAGPRELLIDGLVARTTYQGILVQPWDVGGVANGKWERWELHRCYMGYSNGPGAGAAYLYWQSDKGNTGASLVQPVISGEVYGNPNPEKPTRDQWLWPKDARIAWYDAIQQTLVDPEDLPALAGALSAGVEYVTPGYK